MQTKSSIQPGSAHPASPAAGVEWQWGQDWSWSIEDPLQRDLATAVPFETTDDVTGLEYEGHFSVRNPSLPSRSRTIGYDTNELADTYIGL